MSLISDHDILIPASVAFVTYGIRFIVFAAIAFFALDPSRLPRWGRNCVERPARFDVALNVRRELRQSLSTLCMLTAIFALLYGYGLLAASQLYRNINDYPLWWFWLSIPVLVLLHDTFFYWLHRALHTRWLFAHVHRQHHESLFPTAFTAYSFGWQEALAEALIVAVLIFLVPVHPVAFVSFQTLSIAYNVYGHSGRDLLPLSVSSHWLGRWLNTSTMHAQHHRYSNGNYSFYFSVWDHLMGTLKQDPH